MSPKFKNPNLQSARTLRVEDRVINLSTGKRGTVIELNDFFARVKYDDGHENNEMPENLKKLPVKELTKENEPKKDKKEPQKVKASMLVTAISDTGANTYSKLQVGYRNDKGTFIPIGESAPRSRASLEARVEISAESNNLNQFTRDSFIATGNYEIVKDDGTVMAILKTNNPFYVDRDQDGKIDISEGPDLNMRDVNGDGIDDREQDANGDGKPDPSQDSNGNGVPDVDEPKPEDNMSVEELFAAIPDTMIVPDFDDDDLDEFALE